MREVKFRDMETLVGQEVGVSDWFEIRRDELQAFSDLTRRKFDGSMAHGYHILSLLPCLFEQILTISDIRNGLNYGVENLRFTNIVRAGMRIRLRQKVLAVEPKGEGKLMRSLYTMEIEGEDKPALVGEGLFVFFSN